MINDVKHIIEVPDNSLKVILTKGQLEIMNDQRDNTSEFYINDNGDVFAVCDDGLVKITRDDSIDFLDQDFEHESYYNQRVELNLNAPSRLIMTPSLPVAISTMDTFCYELYDQGFIYFDIDITPDDIKKDINEFDCDSTAIVYSYKNEDGKYIPIGKIVFDNEDPASSFIEMGSEFQELLLEYAVGATYGKFNS